MEYRRATCCIPDVEPKQINLISDSLKQELKELINEVLMRRKYIISGCIEEIND